MRSSILRKEDLSLQFYVKNVILREFVETEEKARLRFTSDVYSGNYFVYDVPAEFTPKPSGRGRGWVYFDTPENIYFCEPYVSVSGTNGAGTDCYGIQEQSDMVNLYNNMDFEVPWRDFIIDYANCRVMTPYKMNNPRITYSWNYVSVIDEWPTRHVPETPIVVIDIYESDKKGYQLGHGRKSVRSVDVHVFASNSAERNDLLETLHDGFFNRSCSLYDFPTGSVLDFDGTFYGRKYQEEEIYGEMAKTKYLFDTSTVENISKLTFDSVKSRTVTNSLFNTRAVGMEMLSDLNAYRGKVSFDMSSYDDRVIN